jgi:hypothetical protein
LGQEFIIKSQSLEDKVNQLLPSQGGFQAGVDLSASTTIIPIVDLTESAEGSNLRQDLQSALSLNSVTTFNVINTTTDLINTTGYFRVFGVSTVFTSDPAQNALFKMTDGTTTKVIYEIKPGFGDPSELFDTNNFDFTVFLEAGHILQAQTGGTAMRVAGCTRQIADISGNLVNP